MSKTITHRYDIAEHLRSPEEMAAYLEACLERLTATQPSLPRRWEMSHAPRAWPKWSAAPSPNGFGSPVTGAISRDGE
jgi:hypothetical protein